MGSGGTGERTAAGASGSVYAGWVVSAGVSSGAAAGAISALPQLSRSARSLGAGACWSASGAEASGYA